jgi:protein-S-isoprenylcysteine O-methyltransferase Ste14
MNQGNLGFSIEVFLRIMGAGKTAYSNYVVWQSQDAFDVRDALACRWSLDISHSAFGNVETGGGLSHVLITEPGDGSVTWCPKAFGKAMRRALAILGSAIFLVIAPGIVAVYVPWRICRWQIAPPLLGISLVRVAGVLLISAGLPVLLDSFARFALKGLGTPAPIFPTRHLVVSGLYRYVRNPMYVAVVSLIFGQGLLFGSVTILEYGMAVSVGFHLFILLYEEPTLRTSFGAEYEEFSAHVPRWLPRLRPWRRPN